MFVVMIIKKTKTKNECNIYIHYPDIKKFFKNFIFFFFTEHGVQNDIIAIGHKSSSSEGLGLSSGA